MDEVIRDLAQPDLGIPRDLGQELAKSGKVRERADIDATRLAGLKHSLQLDAPLV